MKKTIIIFLALCATYSCTDRKDGDWDDNIKLSKKEFQFDAQQHSALITTQGDGWWITEIILDGQAFDLNGIDTTSKNFIITESEFTLERKNGKEITINVFENTTNSERILSVGLQAGNYFDGITITQSSD